MRRQETLEGTVLALRSEQIYFGSIRGNDDDDDNKRNGPYNLPIKQI